MTTETATPAPDPAPKGGVWLETFTFAELLARQQAVKLAAAWERVRGLELALEAVAPDDLAPGDRAGFLVALARVVLPRWAAKFGADLAAADPPPCRSYAEVAARFGHPGPAEWEARDAERRRLLAENRVTYNAARAWDDLPPVPGGDVSVDEYLATLRARGSSPSP